MDTITEIPLDDLHESPFNPRQIFDEADLAELAADIKSHGRLLSPLLVRPRTNPLFKDDPNGSTGFEIVFGHRRYRASRIAELPTARCEVRAMSDEEVKKAQVSENLQRKDVHPLEEASGFQALIDEHGYTVEMIVTQFGKSESYVRARLRLLDLCTPLRQRFLRREIDAEVALLVARLPSVKFQEKALEYIKGANQDLEDGGDRSYRRIRDLLNEKFALDLKEAIFDVEAEMLVPLAGNCVRCVKRTGNAAEFADVVKGNAKSTPGFWSRDHMKHTGADVCTDPDCFAEKKKAHLKLEAAKLEQAGKTVVQGAKARAAIDAYGNIKGGFVKLADVRDQLKKVAKDAKKPEVITIQDPRTGKTHQAVKVEDVKAAGVSVKEPKRSGNDAAARAADAAKREKIGAEAKAMTERNEALLDRLLPVMATQQRTTQELYWMAERVFEGTDWDVRSALAKRHGFERADHMEKVLGQWPADRLALFAIECVLLSDAVVEPYALYDRKKPRAELLEAAAKHYGVALDDPTEPAPTPSTAARAPKSAAAGAGAKKAAGKAKGSKSKASTPAAAGEEQADDAGVAGGSAATSGELFEAAEVGA